MLKSDVIDIVALESGIVSKRDISKIKRSGKVASVFTVNTTSAMKKMIKLDVDTYFTDSVSTAIAVERANRK